MSYSDETVMAYVDDELDAATRAAVAAAAAADPQLAQRIARAQALRARLRAAFEPVLAEPVPPRLLESLEAAPARRVVPLRSRPRPARQWSWPQWAALAAGLVVGAVLGPQLLGGRGADLMLRDGQLQASGALARALDTQLASTQSAAAPVSIGVSFLAKDGDYCRSFTLQAPQALAGVACRSAAAWRLEVVARASPAPVTPDGLRPAASALPASVLGSLEALRAGEPLDAAAEAAARARGWRR
jgi:hypothetical protein